LSEEISIGELVYKAYVKNYLIAHLRYLKAVGERIGMEEALKILERVQWEAGREWFKENGSKLDLITDDAKAGVVLVRRAMKTLIPGPGVGRYQQVVEESQKRSVVRIGGWCPILEASKAVNMDGEVIYMSYVKPYIEAMVKSLNPKLSLSLTKLRPKHDFYEFVIELEE